MSKPPLGTADTDYSIDVNSFRDGKLSVEQQVEILVHDLFNVQGNKDISLEEVLDGLQYVMDYRIKGGRQDHLEPELMKRLCEGLLLCTGATTGHFLRKTTTEDADTAFFLFGELLEEVEEFRMAVSEKPAFELQQSLKIHHRCQPSSSKDQKQAAIGMIYLLTTLFSQFHDWRDLVKEKEQGDMETLLASELAGDIEKKAITKMPQSSAPLLPPPSLYFDRSVKKLLKMFPNTDPEKGLPSDAVPLLREQYGPNKLPEPPKPSALKMLWSQLTDFMVLILLAACIVEAGEQEFNSMAVLLVVIVLNTIIGFTQEWKASKTLEALMHLSTPQATVIRDGVQQTLSAEEVVPGDLVIVEDGEAIPADLRLIEVSQFEAEESILTGESMPVAKTTDAIKAKVRKLPLGDCKGNAFMSTVVAKGRAKGIAVRTGEQTEIGKISSAINASSKTKVKTPIQRKLSRLGKYLVIIAIVLCVLVVVIGIAWKKDVKTMVNVGLSLAVSVIPEGLVAVTTVTMALGVRRMAAAQCVVRTLPAVETLGSVTVVCSDKTGTLTEGKMRTSKLWTADNSLYSFTNNASLDSKEGSISVEPGELRKRMIHLRTSSVEPGEPDPAKSPTGSFDYAALKPHELVKNEEDQIVTNPIMLYSTLVAALCNNSNIHRSPDNEGEWVVSGDPTEIALLAAANQTGLTRDFFANVIGLKKVYERAFDSERKLMSSVLSLDQGQDAQYVLCKGAPEELLSNCSHYAVSTAGDKITCTQGFLKEDVNKSEISDSFVANVSDESSAMAKQGLRVLGLALKKVKGNGKVEPEEEPAWKEDNLVFLGLIGLIDPPKKGVEQSVEICQKAGVDVIMITGDHVETATAIAMQLGIIRPNVPGMDRAILGRELDLLSDDAIVELNPFPNVFARVSPDNKLKIVTALQKRGELVAMTGDGVNDAPAIKQADVGVAMGMAGTEITKQAADIVLVNDNFSTIVAAVEEGRHVFDNILKFIVYLLSCNGAEIFLMLICTAANIETPLTVMMILWANIIADIPPAMALGVEPQEVGLMSRPPRNPKAGVLNLVTWSVIGLQALLMAALTIGAYTIAIYVEHYDVQDARSLAFACLTTIQLLHGLLSRTISRSVFETGILGNKWMIGALVISIGFMLMGIYCPGLNDWLELTPVSGWSWIKIVVCAVIHSIVVETGKLIIRLFGASV
ncbi:hypothetical protein INT43_006382 [Umbelopsis isabellina]|uniref:Cation-transporting P-type ATPase N-terminal domain-containing protein n=1 Tax=Mortierella isabellina TaxID=91625 RepID=A0A8H7Q299_MORIS|nr:hypothetical protein INT43_006382 [Umbelopsis isabellina]